MAFKREKVRYVIYPPDYKPFGEKKYKEAKTSRKAMLIASGMGKGVCEIQKEITRFEKDGSRMFFTQSKFWFYTNK